MVDVLLSKTSNGEVPWEELAQDVAAIALAGMPSAPAECAMWT